MSLSLAGPAAAANPGIANLAPANGTVIDVAPGEPYQFAARFTCPRYMTSYGTQQTYANYFIEYATSPELGPDGTLATAFTVDYGSAFPTNAAETQCVGATAPRVHPNQTYYWQANVTDADSPTINYTGPVWSFTLRAPPSASAPPPPQRKPKAKKPTQTASLHLSARQANGYIKDVIRDHVDGRIRGYRSRCSRVSNRKLRCLVKWRAGRYAYAAKPTLAHYSDKTTVRSWRYSGFSGTRTGCKRGKKSGNACKRRFHW